MLIISFADKIAQMKSYEPKKSLGFILMEVTRLMRRDFDARVKDLGLTQAQWRTIVHLAKQEGCNQAYLADQLDIKPITVTRLVDKLVEAGWVVRSPDPKDRRAVCLHLTDEARPVITVIQEKALETRARALAGIDEEEFLRVFHTLQKMKENLSK